MTGMKFDPAWVNGYARLTAASADALAEGVRTMATDPLTDESFGQLGRTVHTTQAYSSAAQHLREQLTRAVEALGSASAGLAQVRDRYVESDEQGAAHLNRGRS